VGGSNTFRLGDPTLLTLKSTPPLLGHDYLVRITGVDATGQVIAQTPGDLDSMNLSADLAYLLGPTMRIDKAKLFFSLGGTKVTRRPPGVMPAGLADVDAPNPVQGRVQHVTRLGFPTIAPLRSTTFPGRAGPR